MNLENEMKMSKGVLEIGGVKFWWANGLFHVRIGHSTALVSVRGAMALESLIKDYIDAPAD